MPLSDTAVAQVHKIVEVWVCPAPRCGNYYASSSQADTDLAAEMQQGRVEDRKVPLTGEYKPPKHSRAECPDCRQRGEKVERVKVRTTVLIPQG